MLIRSVMQIQGFSRFFTLLALCCLCLSAVAVAQGGAQIASEVEVDATGKDAAEAKTKAHAQAEQQAFKALMEKLSVSTEGMDARRIASLVRGVEVLEEKIAGDRYRAKLRVNFDADGINKLVGRVAAGAPDGTPAVPSSAAVVILPAYEEVGQVHLWEDNLWLAAWRNLGIRVGAGDLVVPYGDAKDQEAVTSQSVSTAGYPALAPLVQRYGAGEVAVLLARFSATPEKTLQVGLRRLGPSRNEVTILHYSADADEGKEQMIERAALDVAEQLRLKKLEEMKNASQRGSTGAVMVVASIGTLSGWSQMRAKLLGLPMVQRIEMLAISAQQADFVLHYRGTADGLADAVTSLGLRFQPAQGYWLLAQE